jgi:hypothetical protein
MHKKWLTSCRLLPAITDLVSIYVFQKNVDKDFIMPES